MDEMPVICQLVRYIRLVGSSRARIMRGSNSRASAVFALVKRDADQSLDVAAVRDYRS